MRALFAPCLLLLPASAWAQNTATVTTNAAIYVNAVVTQSPLRVAAVGTTLQVLDQQGEWVKVAYNDPQWGRRVGWVERRLVRIADEALRPMDLSVAGPPEPAETPQPRSYVSSTQEQPRPYLPMTPTPRLPNHVVARSGLTFGTETSPLFGVEFSGDVLPIMQAYGSFDWHRNAAPKSLQDTFDLLNYTGVDVQLSTPVFAGVGGVKMMLPTGRVRPYMGGGFGVTRGEGKIKVDGKDITQFAVDAAGYDSSDITFTKPLVEVGGGLAIAAGRVYVDVGYRFRKALNVEGVNMSGLYAGIGANF